jgi:hypothetical protein
MTPIRPFRSSRWSAKRIAAAAGGSIFVVVASLAVGACADADTQFSVKYAPSFQKQPTLSILGVFREGRMSPETWEDIGPKISGAFGGGTCPIGYDAKLLSDKRTLAEEIDDYTRANGVTDDLLDQLAPAASGDAVLVVTVSGRPIPLHADGGLQAASAPPPPGPGRAMGGRGGGGPMNSGTPTSLPRYTIDRNAFEMTASLFSPRDHRSVALVTMGYSGHSGAEALQRFVAKLHEAFPNVTCAGWHMNDVPIDEKKIHELKDQG